MKNKFREMRGDLTQKQINNLLGQLDNTADRLREIAAGIETGEY